jgi:hypothetical protein
MKRRLFFSLVPIIGAGCARKAAPKPPPLPPPKAVKYIPICLDIKGGASIDADDLTDAILRAFKKDGIIA